MRFRRNPAQTDHGVFGERDDSADVRRTTIADDEPIGSKDDPGVVSQSYVFGSSVGSSTRYLLDSLYKILGCLPVSFNSSNRFNARQAAFPL